MSLTTRLGLRLEDAKRVPGITGLGYNNPSDLLFWPVALQVGPNFSVTTPIGFSASQDRAEFGLLGQRGFFSEVKQVSFIYSGAGFAFLTDDPDPNDSSEAGN